MKKKAMILIILVLITSFFTTGCFSFSLKPWFLNKKSYDVNEEESISFSDSDVENINIKTIAKKITIVKSDNSSISMNLEGSIRANFEPDIYLDISRNTINYADTNKSISNSNYSNNNLNLEIKLPENLYKDFSLETITGDIFVDSINFDQLNISNVSGNITLDTVKSTDGVLKNVSGDVNLSNSDFFNLELTTVSGKGNLSDIKSNNLTYKSVSGKTLITGDIYGLNVDSVSGDVSIKTSELRDDMSITTVSGDVEIDAETIRNFDFRFRTMSGEIDSSYDLTLERMNDNNIEGKLGSGGNQINVKTTSGDLVFN